MARDYELHIIVPASRKDEAEAQLTSILGSGPHLVIEIENQSQTITHYALSGPIPIKSVEALKTAFAADKAQGGASLKALSIDPRSRKERWNDEDGVNVRNVNGNTSSERLNNYINDKLPNHNIKRREP